MEPKSCSLVRFLFLSLCLSIAACGGGGGSDSGGSDSDSGNSSKLTDLITASFMLDVDKDGDLDIVVGVQGDAVRTADILLINDGKGSFSIKEGAFPDHHLGTGGATVNIESADFNKDGNADIIASTTDARSGTEDDTIQIHLYFGNGDGTFTDATANITGGLVTEYVEWIRVADFDGDTFDDFLITSNGCAEGIPTTICHGGRIYLNDGTGKFSIATVTSTDAKGSYISDNLTWLSDGALQVETTPGRIALDVFVADVNNDTKVDLVAPNGYAGGAIASFINTTTIPGTLSFDIVYTTEPGDPFSTTSFKNGALIDLNNDGTPDMVGSTSIAGLGVEVPLVAFIGQGDGSFVEDNSVFGATQPGVQHARQWLVDDFNNDGFDDLFVADHGFDGSPFPGWKNLLLLNDGAGKLIDVTAANLSIQEGFTHGASSGDVNGDGFVDLFLNNAAIEPDSFFEAEKEGRLWINNGDGSFTNQDLGL